MNPELLVECVCPECAKLMILTDLAPRGRMLTVKWAVAMRARGVLVQTLLDGENIANLCALAWEGDPGYAVVYVEDEQGMLMCPAHCGHACATLRWGKVEGIGFEELEWEEGII